MRVDRRLWGTVLVGGALGWLGLSSAPTRALAGDPCVATKFDTKLVAEACKQGGKDKAKEVLKAWQKAVNDKDPTLKITCKTCHTVLDPSFDLKPDGLKRFRELGGQ
jgi:hypothetical protein